MSIRVEMSELAAVIVARGGGFLLTSIMDSRPHAAHHRFEVASEDGQVEVRAKVGRTSYANCKQQPSVSVLWPALASSGAADSVDEPGVEHHSLIVDGQARLDGPEHVIIRVTGAVYHRPAQ